MKLARRRGTRNSTLLIRVQDVVFPFHRHVAAYGSFSFIENLASSGLRIAWGRCD